MNPQLRKRFIDSIEYLRRMDFFKDYSNLSSEEIFDRILSGEISYETHWFAEEWSKEERRKMKEEDIRERPLEEMFEEREEHWMKASDFEVDLRLAFFDSKRFFVEDDETVIERGMCKMLMRKLARISRGVFKPTYIREKMLEWKWEPPPALGKAYHDAGFTFKVCFRFKGEEHSAEFYSDGDYLHMDPLVRKINELIKDTGYQYYCPGDSNYIVYAVFSSDEVERLKKRGWSFFPI